ncbi:hypothetical protein [Microbacterium album]|uniref:Uncharacterized protein n=1 Tax=Microbacterium album TaxID=2053191 RepID=A0A917IF92_9MICO|nr:hypothetical protein [Microbacterium album]GGH47250.1 hypothetical protein GCM10010921_23840 [Microbacterium album]
MPRPAVAARAALDELTIGAGDIVLVSAASGAVGSLYSQLALSSGASVIGRASALHDPHLTSLGIVPIEYGAGLIDRVRQSAPLGLTAVQDCHGGETIAVALELGVQAERICTITGYAAKANFDVRMPTDYRCTQQRLEEFAALAASEGLQIG